MGSGRGASEKGVDRSFGRAEEAEGILDIRWDYDWELGWDGNFNTSDDFGESATTGILFNPPPSTLEYPLLLLSTLSLPYLIF